MTKYRRSIPICRFRLEELRLSDSLRIDLVTDTCALSTSGHRDAGKDILTIVFIDDEVEIAEHEMKYCMFILDRLSKPSQLVAPSLVSV